MHGREYVTTWAMPIVARDHDEYLAQVEEPDKRAALAKLRAQLTKLLPGAEETISYGLPTFKLGRGVMAYGVAAKHCALYPMSGEIVAAFADELADFGTSKGTIRFTPEKPLPAALVKKLVKARLAEMATSGKG